METIVHSNILDLHLDPHTLGFLIPDSWGEAAIGHDFGMKFVLQCFTQKYQKF